MHHRGCALNRARDEKIGTARGRLEVAKMSGQIHAFPILFVRCIRAISPVIEEMRDTLRLCRSEWPTAWICIEADRAHVRVDGFVDCNANAMPSPRKLGAQRNEWQV